MGKIESDAARKRPEVKRPLTDLETQILALYRQLSPIQKKIVIVLLSAMLSAAANNQEEVQA